MLNTLNTRLDAAILAFTLDHAEAKVLITDREYSKVIKEALALAKVKPLVIDYDDPEYPGPGERLGTIDYEEFLSDGDPDFAWKMPDDEWDAICAQLHLRHHRRSQGRRLSTTAAPICSRSATCSPATWRKHPVYLWTLPMFHCNGWCFPWTVSVVAGTHVCLRQVRAAPIFDAIAEHKVTHLCGAPIVMSTLLNAPETEKKPLPHTVEFVTAAAPPPEAVLAAMREAGFNVTHVYGLTETYGPASSTNGTPSGTSSPRPTRRRRRRARACAIRCCKALDVHGSRDHGAGARRRRDARRGHVPRQRGDDAAISRTSRRPTTAFAGGWFHSGDLGVMHPDGYIQLKDRSKDIIISGGENISSIEVEDALYKHPAVQAVAVVAKPDEKWGETPCAFVELKPGATATNAELIAWCREHLASYKCPRHLVFAELPKTSTGKMQKFKLREMAKEA